MNKRRLLLYAKFKKIQGIEAAIFGLLLLFLPVNLAKHFFFNFAYVEGILVDYLIPTVYLTDILIGVLLLLWLLRFLKCGQYSGTYRCTIRVSRPLVVFGFGIIVASCLSIFVASNQPAAVYKFLKVVEYILFSFYVSKHVDLKRDFPTIVKILSIGVLFESVLAVAQWFKQGSLFGYYFFGENKYTVSTPGVAILDFAGIRKARPYGTFPHPNMLGGYLAVVLPWIFYMGLKGVKGVKGKRFYFLTLGLGLAALILSFSRSAWVVGIFGLLGILAINFKEFSSLSRFFFPSSILPRRQAGLHLPSSILYSLSFLRRAELNWIALEMIKDHPLLGVGLNNFTVAMDKYGEVSGWVRFLQPVHNVYLLIAAEIGLVGLGIFLCLLFSASRLLLKKKNYLLLISVIQVVILCFVDHYFFTLQQTGLLFWLVVGLAFSTADLPALPGRQAGGKAGSPTRPAVRRGGFFLGALP